MTKPPSEKQIQNAIRLALAREPGLVLFRLNQGAGILVARDALEQLVDALRQGDVKRSLAIALDLVKTAFNRWGLPKGAADLIGVLNGRFVALEVKSAKGRLSEHQRLWGELVRSRGGFYAAVRSVADAQAAITRARAGATA